MTLSNTEAWWWIINSFCKEAWTCSLCLCSKSFHMCQWRQWFPDDSGFWWSSCTSVLSHGVNVKIGGCSLQCRPLLGCFQDRSCVCESVYEHGSLRCPLSALHSPAPSHAFRAETDACAGASASSFPPFRKQTPEEKTDPHRSAHPSVHTSIRDWVSGHAIVPSFQPGTESNVSKAASPSKQSNIRAILQSSPQLSLFF